VYFNTFNDGQLITARPVSTGYTDLLDVSTSQAWQEELLDASQALKGSNTNTHG